eukprot:CAMPEP_0202694468 /NCGR_PEP_ID=MMETSP1385-20130828/8324_1 /ASSEMBLY_ACC=CAM_ASM_000861 /TAXON_ID=933848 /ORGANISM="Elphidium margaritaceum" /LENGTH=732 /DNA_ID=CAMNT_0049350321 /DNA_START=25 /DNA_END=2223 /DNA_ORIENTATION=-
MGADNQPLSAATNQNDQDALTKVASIPQMDRGVSGFHADTKRKFPTGAATDDTDFNQGDDDANDTFRQIVDDTLKTLTSKQMHTFIDTVVDEVSPQYPSAPNNADDTIVIHDATSDDDTKQADATEHQSDAAVDPYAWVAEENKVENINNIFRYIRQLGAGASCRVLKARHLKNQRLYAVKELNKDWKDNLMCFRKEVEILRKCLHQNILSYSNCYVDNKCLYIATEFCDGGTMLDKVIKMKSFSEQKAAELIRFILSAISYMHELNIVHRDLKAQNMVFDEKGPEGVLKIIDFGDSLCVEEEKTYAEFVGTIHYVPPEIVRPRTGKELKKSDMWSVGVICYLLCCGRPPYSGRTQKQILANIVSKNKKLCFPEKAKLSVSCKDFISKLLCDDPSIRLSASEAMEHEWISGGASVHDLSSEVMESLRGYNYNNKLQGILVNAVLTEMETEEQEILNEGLMNLNRQTSLMDTDAVVDYLLLHSSIDELPHHNKQWQADRVAEIKYHALGVPIMKGAHEDFNEQEIDDVLDEMDKLYDDQTFMPMQCAIDNVMIKSPPSKVQTGSPAHTALVPLDLDDDDEAINLDDMDFLDLDLGIDDDEDDEDEKEMNQEAHSRSGTGSMRPSFRKIASADLPSLSPNLSATKSVDFAKRRISIGRFRAIMGKADKNYDVETLVDELNDGTGHITLTDIASYSKRVETLKNVHDIYDTDDMPVPANYNMKVPSTAMKSVHSV